MINFFKMDGIEFLQCFSNNSIKTIFFDPQYDGILRKMNYGNHNRMKQRFNLKQMNDETIKEFIMQIERILCDSGYLFLWVDKYHLIDIENNFHKWTKKLVCVDCITWDKCRIGMGYRTRRKCEYLVILQKPPIIAKKTWKIHDIPDVWQEKSNKSHAHSKPIQLQTRLIEATTNEGDFVLDPACGGLSVMHACINSNRNFIGVDCN